MKYYFTKELYNKEALLKAAYCFTDVAYVHLDADEQNYIVDIKLKGENKESKITELDFQNEILAQMVRQNISKETKNVRELMIARAFSSTIIENHECVNSVSEDNSELSQDEKDILMDWFEKYE